MRQSAAGRRHSRRPTQADAAHCDWRLSMPYASNWMPATVLVSEDVTIRVPALSAQLTVGDNRRYSLFAFFKRTKYSAGMQTVVPRTRGLLTACLTLPLLSTPKHKVRTRALVPRGSATQSRRTRCPSRQLSKGEGRAKEWLTRHTPRKQHRSNECCRLNCAAPQTAG